MTTRPSPPLPACRWLLAALTALAGCGGPPAENGSGPTARRRAEAAGRLGRLERSLSRAARFLLDRQAVDGAWRSNVYGPFKDGPSLTPWVLQTLHACRSTPRLQAACRRGSAYLAALARPDGTIDEGKYGFSYPVYTAAGAVTVLSRPEDAARRQARAAWLTYLRRRQLTDDLGWRPSDREYGGWGFSSRLPRKPKQEALTESNISATVFALEALRAAGVPRTDPAFRKALTFVRRCQNYEDEPKRRHPVLDDGGFFFIYDDPDRNKAGLAGREDSGRERFFSYGSTTADGLRCLSACGLPPDHVRVRAARAWLERRFQAGRNPGHFAEGCEGKRQATYYYYAWSVSRALAATDGPTIRTPRGRVAWAEELADELLKRQRRDGSWSNPASLVREDDPVVATCLAASALAACRRVVAAR
jgi:squalene-hopene/tetraprenyl-beta-curcumene cyclase